MFSSSQKIKFAVIGSGHIGRRHSEMIRRNPEAELVAMVDVKSKDELGITSLDVPFYSTIDDLLNSGIEFDVACICTPNGLHAEHSIKALENKKHVVVEKPMALTVAECEKIIFKALQVIAFNARPATRNDTELAEINQAVNRIQWALREIVPKLEPQFTPFEGSARLQQESKGTPPDSA